MPSSKRYVRIVHQESGVVLAEGPIGWGITPFEGNYYISKRWLKTRGFKPNWVPGFCPYKFFYVWVDLDLDSAKERSIAWMYWLPNPLLPFIWFRIAVPGAHPALRVGECREFPVAPPEGYKPS
jgi:hypothetical protein